MLNQQIGRDPYLLVEMFSGGFYFMRWTDISIGSILVLGSVYFLSLARKFPTIMGAKKIPGPSFFPNIVLSLLLILGILTIVKGLINNKIVEEYTKEEKIKGSLKQVLLIIFLILFYELLIKAGLIIYVTPLFIFIMALFLLKWESKQINYKMLIIQVILSSVVIYLFFIRIFKIPIM